MPESAEDNSTFVAPIEKLRLAVPISQKSGGANPPGASRSNMRCWLGFHRLGDPYERRFNTIRAILIKRNCSRCKQAFEIDRIIY